MFAIFETGGKQYKVNEGDILFIEKLGIDEGEDVTFDKVLALSRGSDFTVGTPYIDGASIVANVVKNGKSTKIHVFTYKPKKNQKKKMGHRQPYTKIQIQKITG